MRREPRHVHVRGSLLDDMPDRLFRDTVSPEFSRPTDTSEQRNNGPFSIPAAASHASSVSFTQLGTGTVRMCLPLPMRSTMAHRSSRRCNLSSVSSASSRRRNPQPSSTAKIAGSRWPVRVWLLGTCKSADASPAVSQLPNREPSLRTPLTRWIPAASSGLNRPESAASKARRRTAAIRTLIVPEARPRSSR